MSETTPTIREWVLERAASWKGLNTAFSSGARTKFKGGSPEACNYKRQDFADAWINGYLQMEKYLEEDGKFRCGECGAVYVPTPTPEKLGQTK